MCICVMLLKNRKTFPLHTSSFPVRDGWDVYTDRNEMCFEGTGSSAYSLKTETVIP
jgi:hypothetical protein